MYALRLTYRHNTALLLSFFLRIPKSRRLPVILSLPTLHMIKGFRFRLSFFYSTAHTHILD